MESFFQVVAFTQQPFGGNPAGVVITDSAWSTEFMQQVAMQNNLPATAFLNYADEGFKIRWFTAKKELALCGHATLASAHVLFSKDIVPAGNRIHFTTDRNDLYAWYENGWITMDFPAFPCEAVVVPADLRFIFAGKFKAGFYTQDKFLIELENESAVKNFIPDFNALAKYKCIITAETDPGSRYDFVSRFFDLPDGIPEDAVTGSAHCSLASFWSARLGKNYLSAFQASSRGGELKLMLDQQHVQISGQALTVIEGRYLPFIQKELQKN
ncbi:MAG TPA: PhzF family phenazine biosynthesis protein [Puia sp.]